MQTGLLRQEQQVTNDLTMEIIKEVFFRIEE